MLTARRPTCLSTKRFWADQIHLSSHASGSQWGKLVLEKRLEQWEPINSLQFSQAEAQWFKAPSDHAFVFKERRFVLQELHRESIIRLLREAPKLRCLGEMLALKVFAGCCTHYFQYTLMLAAFSEVGLMKLFRCKGLELSLCTWEGIPRRTGPARTR